MFNWLTKQKNISTFKIEVGKYYLRRDGIGPVQILAQIGDDGFLSDLSTDGKTYYHRTKAYKNAAVYTEKGEWIGYCSDNTRHARDLVCEIEAPSVFK